MPGHRYRVFLSHTGDDEALARYLAARIEAVGADAFTYRRDARIGDDPDDMIEREIQASDEILILLTPRSLDRMYIGYEYGLARAHKLWISAARFYLTFAEVNGTPNMVHGLKEKQFDLNLELDRYLGQLRDRIAAALPDGA
jgi:hypothetical protein